MRKTLPDVKNPFEYGSVVGERAFCNRRQEMRDLRRTVENAGRLFLYAERRMGKTSLIRRVLEGLPQKEYTTAYVDLWPTESPAAFTEVLAKALAEATSTTADRMLETAGRLFSSLRPSVTVDEGGAPVLTFGADPPTGAKPELEEVLTHPRRSPRRKASAWSWSSTSFSRLRCTTKATSSERFARSFSTMRT